MSSRPNFALAGEDPQVYGLTSALTYIWDVPTLTWVKNTGGGSGGGAATIADGADVAEGTTTDVAWVSGAGTVISILKTIAAGGANAPLTAASPTAASVGVASAQAVAANANRKGLVLVNTSTARISFGIGAAAVLDSGITLMPSGGVWEMDPDTFTTGAINAIASGAASNLAIQELT